MTVIGTNIASLRAANASNSASEMLKSAMERLSTGKRINSSKDDAAGQAIASTMTASIRGMGQAIRNANDGISLAQTADGALNEVTNMLQRIRELAVQSASGTYSNDDRTNMQTEVAQLGAQIDDVIANTKFNGVSLFDSSDVTVTIQTGSSSADTVDLTVTALDLSDATALGHLQRAPRSTTSTPALAAVATTRASLGAGESRLQSVVNNLTTNVSSLTDARRPHRGRRFLGRDDAARQGSDPQPGVDGDARPGEPEPAGGPAASPFKRVPVGCHPPDRHRGRSPLLLGGGRMGSPGGPRTNRGFSVSARRRSAKRRQVLAHPESAAPPRRRSRRARARWPHSRRAR